MTTTSEHDHNANQGNADEDLKIVKVVKKLQDGERLTSAIFIITVGPRHEEYAVHQSYLNQSPVLGAMCRGDFKESYERRISLPDDQPKVVAAIVEYLYTGNFWVNQKPSSSMGEKQKSALVLADIYIAADKYQLNGLKELVVARLEGYTELLAWEVRWLDVAQLIYSSTPDSDAVYPRFLRSLVVKWMELERVAFGAVGMRVVESYVEQGGRLAVDLLRAQRRYWLLRVQSRNAVIQKERHHHGTAHGHCREMPGPELKLHDGDLDDQDSRI